MSEQYTYAVARIRALEVSLFSDATIDQLMACQTYEQCLQFLAEQGWGDGETNPEAEAMLAREEEKIWEIVGRTVAWIWSSLTCFLIRSFSIT